MATQFKHSDPGILAGSTRTLLYGPAEVGTTVVVFSGLFSNVDNTNQTNHWVTLEVYDGTVYTTKLNRIPIPFGSSSMCPKIVLLQGESLYVTADAANVVSCSVEAVILS